MALDVLSLIPIVGQIGQLARDIRAAITGKEVIDPTRLAEIEAKLNELDQALLMAQIEINKAEATHPSVFVAGWRPFVGWICGLSFGWHFLGAPIANFIIRIYKPTFELPSFDIQTLVTVLFGMLGLGLYRSLEKKWGVQDQH